MNNKGFTLVEVLVVVVLLGLILGIAIPGVSRAGKRAKERTLVAKVENIEKAAILYAQDKDNNVKFDRECTSYNNDNPCDGINNCFCSNEITVDKLANPDGDNSTDDGYIKYDNESNLIVNPTMETKNINGCPIIIYKKYGKIYAIYKDKTKKIKAEVEGSDIACWVVR